MNPAELIHQFQGIIIKYPEVRKLFSKIQYVTNLEEVTDEINNDDELDYNSSNSNNSSARNSKTTLASNYYDITLDHSCIMEKNTKCRIHKRTELSYNLSAEAIKDEFRKMYEMNDSCFRLQSTRTDISHFFENVFYYPFKNLPLEWWIQMKKNIQKLIVVYMVMENELTRIFKTPISGIPQFLVHIQKYIIGLEKSAELEELRKTNEQVLDLLPNEWRYLWFNIR